jgi:hypothetical protein
MEFSGLMLHKLLRKIWEEEKVPGEWKERNLIKLSKMSDISDCSNYRGITLLARPRKLFSRVVLNRMRDAVDPILRDQQAGFKKGRS